LPSVNKSKVPWQQKTDHRQRCCEGKKYFPTLAGADEIFLASIGDIPPKNGDKNKVDSSRPPREKTNLEILESLPFPYRSSCRFIIRNYYSLCIFFSVHSLQFIRRSSISISTVPRTDSLESLFREELNGLKKVFFSLFPPTMSLSSFFFVHGNSFSVDMIWVFDSYKRTSTQFQNLPYFKGFVKFCNTAASSLHLLIHLISLWVLSHPSLILDVFF